MKQPVIKTKDFTLRPLRMSDAETLAGHADNKKIARFLADTFPHPYFKKDAEKFISEKLKEKRKKEPKEIVFGIETNEKLCGVIGLHEIVFGHKAELGYWLGNEFWSGGIMTKAVKKIVKYAFGELRLKRVSAYVKLENKGSKIVLEKNGFEPEGIARKEMKKNGRYYDTYRFSKINS